LEASVGDPRGRARPRDSPEQPAAAGERGQPGGDAERAQRGDRAGVTALRLLLLDAGIAAKLLQARSDPLGGLALPRRGGRPIDRAKGLDGRAQVVAVDAGNGLL